MSESVWTEEIRESDFNSKVFGNFPLLVVLQPKKVKFSLRLGQSKPIYNAFKAIRKRPDWHTLSGAYKCIV